MPGGLRVAESTLLMTLVTDQASLSNMQLVILIGGRGEKSTTRQSDTLYKEKEVLFCMFSGKEKWRIIILITISQSELVGLSGRAFHGSFNCPAGCILLPHSVHCWICFPKLSQTFVNKNETKPSSFFLFFFFFFPLFFF